MNPTQWRVPRDLLYRWPQGSCPRLGLLLLLWGAYGLLQKADEMLDTALRALRPDQPIRRTVPGIPPDPSCNRCHFGFPRKTRNYRFAGFDHSPHLLAGLPCSSCHRGDRPNHGKLIIGRQECAGCHPQYAG